MQPESPGGDTRHHRKQLLAVLIKNVQYIKRQISGLRKQNRTSLPLTHGILSHTLTAEVIIYAQFIRPATLDAVRVFLLLRDCRILSAYNIVYGGVFTVQSAPVWYCNTEYVLRRGVVRRRAAPHGTATPRHASGVNQP